MVMISFVVHRRNSTESLKMNGFKNDGSAGARLTVERGRPSVADQNGDPITMWEQDLKRQLTLLKPYLVAGHAVTFQAITAEERAFFTWITETVSVPGVVCAVFIPPSVVQRAMWPGIRRAPSDKSSELYSLAPDAGAVVAVRRGSLETIVNALFALPPFSPGIDVYQNGRLIAGYSYRDHRECADGLSEALKTYLK
jgi:hypothetical protein